MDDKEKFPSAKCDNSKTCLMRPLKTSPKIGFLYLLLPNAGQKYCRMLKREHSAILSAFIKLSFAFDCLFLSGRLRQVLLYFLVKVCGV